MGPHADDCLSEHVAVEAISSSSIGNRFAAPRAHATGESFENSRADVGGFSAGMKDDPNQVALFFGESDEGFGLGLHHLHRLALIGARFADPVFEFPRRFFCEFAKERKLVLEMEIESARGISSLSGDRMTGDGVRSQIGKERSPGFQ